MNPRHPVYVISKGRWDTRFTSLELDRIEVPYKIVVEPQEYDEYAKRIDHQKILCAPEDFSKLGCGSIPVRNFVWEHSIESGASWHWIMDDNIQAFWRLCHNLRIRVADGTIFRCAEDFVDRYENIGQAGLQYYMFCPDRVSHPAYLFNTRIYSCILNRNDVPYRWRGRYNEDTDLSIRILKDGWCTILFNAFLAQKAPTGTVKGGNMEHLYGGNKETAEKSEAWQKKRYEMAKSLQDQHPDIVTITTKWGRPQHQVDYSPFKKNKLIRKPGWNYSGVDNYGMKIIEIKKPEKSNLQVTPPVRSGSKQQVTPASKPKKEFDPDYWKKQGFYRDPRADIQNI